MGLSVGIALTSPGAKGVIASASAAGPIFQNPPSVSPGVPEVGVPNTATDGNHLARGGGTVTFTREWFVNGTKVADGASYTAAPSDAGNTLVYRETPREIGGDTPGLGQVTSLNLGTVVLAAPTATGSIEDQDLTLSGDPVVVTANVATLFDGANLSFAVAGFSGASLNGTELEIDPNTAVSAATVTLTASNSGGSAAITFRLDVEALAFASLSLSGPGTIGASHTISATANRAGAALAYAWQDAQGPIGGANQASFTPGAAQDGEALFCTVTASLDGTDIAADTNAIAITFPAPTANGALADQSFGDDTGIQTYDVSGDFTGQDLSFGLSAAPSGVSIASGTGLVSFDTDALAVQSGTPVVVEATNSGGAASSGFSFDITGGDTTAPVVNLFSVSQAAQDAPLTVSLNFVEADSLPITLYMVGQVSGQPPPSETQIVAGQAQDGSAADIAGSFSASADGSQTVTGATLQSGDYDFYAVAIDAQGNRSGLATDPNVTLSYAASHVFLDDFTSYTNGFLLRDSALYNEYDNTGSRVMEVQNGTLTHGGTGTCNLRLTYEGHIFSGDHYFEAVFDEVPDQSGEAPVLMVGWQDSENYYAARIRHTDIDIRRRQTATGETVLDTKPFIASPGDVFRLEHSGNVLTLSVNGTTELSASDTTFAGGRCGYRVFVSGAVSAPPFFNSWEFGE